MSRSGLLSALYYSDEEEDEEFTLNQINEQAENNNNNNNNNYYYRQPYSEDEEDEEHLLEAPSSLLIERQPQPQRHEPNKPVSIFGKVTTYDRTMWRWANVENMDTFFQRVYEYYEGKGFYCIILARLLNLLTLGFMIIFSTFLIGCVNYKDIPSHHKLSEVIEPQCLSKLSFTKATFLFIFIMWWIYQAIRFITDIPLLKEMHNFYTHLLLVPDQDMQTVNWETILERIIDIRENNPNINDIKLTEHDVASRIMRKENYLVALFNKDVFNIQIPLPYLNQKNIFTKDLEWNLSFCLLSFIFDDRGQIRKRFLKEKNKQILSQTLKRRFIFMGLINLLLFPFIFAYLLVYFFFRYFEEYHKNPGEIGTRTYTPFAKWKFREFNELPHLFKNRLSQSHESANLYINQFPKEKTILVARFVSFLSGSIAGVLALFTLFDSEALLNFEITNNGTVLFYLGITGTIFAVTRGMVPDENQVFEPEKLLRQVIEHIHYLPNEWKHQLHTDQVRGEFCKLFDYKVGIFSQELLSVLFAPLVLCISLPKCSDQIIDFFREFTVHVDGLGYVCSFSQFDFEKHGNVKYGVEGEPKDEYYVSKEGKMEKSFLNFKANNPNWKPSDMMGSMYLSRIQENTKLRRRRLPSTSSSSEASIRQKGKEKESVRLNEYGIPVMNNRIQTNLGDSFEEQEKPWNYQQSDDDEDLDKREGMIGLLNQFYDLNNKPTL